ncbi:MAG: PAS domain S-box protein [Sulfuritalea sp.]|nr:PAS domain S-box protein [Sulfuritalea sp.]
MALKPHLPRDGDAAAGLSRRVDNLLHELHEQRSELELRNDELRHSQADVQTGLERYTDLYDLSPVGLVTLDSDGAIVRVNLTAALLLGRERSRLIGSRFAEFATAADRPGFHTFLQSVHAGEARQSCELELTIDGQLSRTVQIDATLSADRRECRLVVADISERKLAAAMLLESSRFNEQVIANVQEGIVVYGPDLRYRVWNTYMEIFTGMKACDVLGRHPRDVFPFLEERGVFANLESALAGGVAKSVTFPFQVRQTGRAGWALDRTAPLRNARGEIIGVIGTVTDVTEQRRAQEALTASTQFVRSLIDSMQDGFSAVDLKGVHLDVNPALCRMTGFSREELIGSGVPHPYWPPEQYEFILGEFRRVSQGELGELELIFMRRNGERFPVMITPSAVRDGNGQIVSYAATVKDVTERKQAEEILAASQRRFRDIVNTTDGIVWEADAKTFDFTFISRQAERLLGYPVTDWLQPGFWVRNLHPDDKEWAPEYCLSCTERMMPHDFEYRFMAQDGRTVWLHDIVTVVEENGAPRWLRGIMVDITHRKQAEQQLREMAESLEFKVAERTAQLRRLSAQLAMTEERERRKLAQDLHDNLGQLLAVMKIKLTSISAGGLQPLIDQVVALVAQADQAARNITQQLSPPVLYTLGLVPALQWLAEDIERVYGVMVHVDHDDCRRRLVEEVQAVLYRAARELLINVAKHAGVRDASLSCLCSDSRLMLVVSDAGCGFEPADHLGAWPGYQSFGLRSIYERIANIGGEMEVDSSPGNGTTITLSVPHSIGDKEICNDPHNACR